eukprot:gnl/MRDRNA2_/MRDRNA2_93336_c0_seq1.p1 gnl/MRDRNA2_/MRDRNA2_93336_c0~~gnl/MRDRNA2_/MRDRNA2_93336_c0_seq1.p1  ORF type:complete len:213 (-),score=74.41 gnl/MRDRNA2_/MRDRNA2_93336_c0_seq1:20-658(-)
MSSCTSMALLVASIVHLMPLASAQDMGCAAELSELSLLQHGIQRATQDLDEPGKGWLHSDLPYDEHNDLESFTYARQKAEAEKEAAAPAEEPADAKADPAAASKSPAKEAALDTTPPPPPGLLQFEASRHSGEPTEDSEDFQTDSPTTPGPERGDGFLEDDLPFDNHNPLESASYALKAPEDKPEAKGADSEAAETKEAPKAAETKDTPKAA